MIKAGQVQRLYTEHPYGVKRESDPTGNRGPILRASQTSSPEPIPAALVEWRCLNLPNSGNPCDETTEPREGDIRKATDIGYKGHAEYIRTLCVVCKTARWVRLKDYKAKCRLVCRSCGSPFYRMTHTTGYVLEHRFVVARDIGRCLLDTEVVHHINGIRHDNRRDNLELLSSNAEHLPYILLQQQIYELQATVERQSEEIRLLKWHIKEIEQGNPELAGYHIHPVSVETLQEASVKADEEKVHPSGKSGD